MARSLHERAFVEQGVGRDYTPFGKPATCRAIICVATVAKNRRFLARVAEVGIIMARRRNWDQNRRKKLMQKPDSPLSHDLRYFPNETGRRRGEAKRDYFGEIGDWERPAPLPDKQVAYLLSEGEVTPLVCNLERYLQKCSDSFGSNTPVPPAEEGVGRMVIAYASRGGSLHWELASCYIGTWAGNAVFIQQTKVLYSRNTRLKRGAFPTNALRRFRGSSRFRSTSNWYNEDLTGPTRLQ